MDNSDDYFQDSFELDDSVLAVLAAEEAKYAESVSQIPTRPPDSLPPAKRPKLSHRRASEEILDVFLRTDGTYGVAGVSILREEDRFARAKSPTVGQKTSIAGQFIGGTESVTDIQCSEKQAFEEIDRVTREEPMRTISVPERAAVRAGGTPDHGPPVAARPEIERQLADLRSTVEMLRVENDKMKAALRDAENARFAKDGEVTILRKKVEKTAQQHSEAIIKLKEAKEAADQEQARLQKELKQQMERLRTEYTFKQHEVDSSTRKPVWSSKSKRMTVGPQMSPVPVPPVMKSWVSVNGDISSKSSVVMDTPSRQRLALEQKGQAGLSTRVRARPTSSEMKFPGFENSFLPSSPLNSPSRPRRSVVGTSNTAVFRTPTRRKKPKDNPERSRDAVLSPTKISAMSHPRPEELGFDELLIDDAIQDFDGNAGCDDFSSEAGFKATGIESSPNVHSVGDIGFSHDVAREFSVEEGTLEGIDWSEELHCILFAHSCRVSDGLTFQYLLRADLSDREYQQSCSGILEIFGTKCKFATVSDLMDAVAQKMVLMAFALWEAEKPRHLQALFELMSDIITHIPAFTCAMLRKQDNTERLFRLFSDVPLKSVDGRLEDNDIRVHHVSLVHSALSLLEAIAWTIPDDIQSWLEQLLGSARIFVILLDNKQPSSILSRTIRVLVVLASHPSVSRMLSSSQSEGLRSHSAKVHLTDYSRLSLLERLPSFLVDPGALPGSRADEELSSILTFFANLTARSPTVKPRLLNSLTFIPCLIHYLARLSMLLWEDDEQVMKCPERAKWTVQNMRQGLCLLHQLVIPSQLDGGLDFDFRQKLVYAPHPTFNGLTHMFIVMIGRLSCADPPDWLDADLQQQIEKLTEPSRDLMDLIIEGPEGDSVWVAYQDTEVENSSDIDDEMVAQLY